MKQPKNPMIVFWGAAALLTALLVALPPTGYLLRMQLGMLFRASPSLRFHLHELGVKHDLAKVTPAELDQRRQALENRSASHPGDLSMKLAAAANVSDSPRYPDDILERLDAIAAKEPDNPVISAQILRMMSLGKVHIHREEENWADGKPKPPVSQIPAAVSNPEDVRHFYEVAARGGKTDPDNAFFPMMEAVALFAARKDEEAISAMRRAAQKPRWDDYALVETEGRVKLEEAAFGRQTMLVTESIFASTLFPHYASMRGAARMMRYYAVIDEQSGQKTKGMSVRHDLIHCASRMRVQSRSFIGSLVAIAMEAIGIANVGGVPLPADVPADKKRQALTAAYASVLRENGQEKEADWVQEDAKSMENAEEVGRLGLGRSPTGSEAQRTINSWWIANLLVLSNVAWLLVLCGAGAILYRMKAANGLAIGVILVLLLAAAAVTWMSHWLEMLGLIQSVYANLTSDGSAQSPSVSAVLFGLITSPLFGPILTVFVGLLVPMIALIWSGMSRRAKGGSFAEGWTESLPKFGGALCFSLLVVYAVTLLVTSYKDLKMRDAYMLSLRHEGRYYATLAGKSWPGEPGE